MQPVIHITQDSPLLDCRMELHVSDLIPYELYTLKAEMYDNFGTKWESIVEYKSDGNGEIDLSTAQPVSGTYSSPDATGLFWSMVPVRNVGRRERTPLKAIETKLTLMKGQSTLAAASVIRHVVSPDVDRIPLREEGLVGTFFRHSTSGPLPAVIVLGGSEGGLRESTAALLASHGYHTLAVAYFGMEDLPKELVNIPLEYIGKAIDWLRGNPNVDAARIGIIGTSKGGELALASASEFPLIKAVVGYVPSGVVYPGIGQSAESSWTLKGVPLPFAYADVPVEITEEVNQAKKIGIPISWRSTYQHWAEGETTAEIAVETINGPILLISGGDDKLWPADWLSEKVIARLKACKHPFSIEHLKYPRAGHSIGVPGLPTTQSVVSSYGNGTKLLLGGNPKENSAAQYHAWKEKVNFFNEHLTGNSN